MIHYRSYTHNLTRNVTSSQIDGLIARLVEHCSDIVHNCITVMINHAFISFSSV